MKKIKSIEIKNSPFYENIKIQFDEKLNCIMGGRGTGKSTLLHLLRIALIPHVEIDSKTINLLKYNLGFGEVVIEMESKFGEFFRISKTINDEPQPYQQPEAKFISLEKIYEEIECDFYETGKIEEIGRSPIDRLRLVDKKIGKKVKNLKLEVSNIQNLLNSNSNDIKSINNRIENLQQAISQYENIELEFLAHRSNSPKELNGEKKTEFENANQYEGLRFNEANFINRIFTSFSSIQTDSANRFHHFKSIYNDLQNFNDNFQNIEQITQIKNLSLSAIERLLNLSVEIQNEVNGFLTILNSESHTLKVKHQKDQAEFIVLKQQFEEHQEYINKFNLLSKRISEKKHLQSEITQFKKKKDEVQFLRKSLIDKFNIIKQNIFNLRHEVILSLNAKFDGAIVINLTPGGIKTHYELKLRESLKGSGLRYNELVSKIVDYFSPLEFAKAINTRDYSKFSNALGIDSPRISQLIENLFESDSIYDIESIFCEDYPEFKLKIKEGSNSYENYRSSELLSMGQRCTAVLPIIFAVSDNPLIIDQPEDNLDNKYISEKIHEIIREEKSNRQLILITHNPNIPVLSNSEHNVFLKFDLKSNIEKTGSVQNVKSQIIELLEGGEKAFKRRSEIYGY